LCPRFTLFLSLIPIQEKVIYFEFYLFKKKIFSFKTNFLFRFCFILFFVDKSVLVLPENSFKSDIIVLFKLFFITFLDIILINNYFFKCCIIIYFLIFNISGINMIRFLEFTIL